MESTSKRAAASSVRYTFSDEDEQDWEVDTVKKPAGKKKKEEKLKTVVCKICHKKYTDRECLRRHMELHKDTLDWTCEICENSFKTRGYLVRHQKLVHAPRTHECEFCGKTFAMSYKLDQHKLVHTGEKPHKCEVCGKTFRARYSLNTHVLTHTNEKPYKCQYCPYACRDNSTLRRHHERHTGTLKWYECPYCDKKYYNRTLLKNHVAERHFDTDLKVIPCPQCFGKFRTPGALNRHIKTVHERALRVQCEVCGQEVANKNNMASHMRVHIQLRPYKCKFKKCHMKFKDMSTLRKHSLIHKPAEQLPCEVCGKLFARRHRLNVHMKRHGDDTKFKIMFCDYCGFSYDNRQCLVRHILKHVRHRNTYACDVCKYVTHRKLSIEKHMKYGHGDEDDRYCKICDKSYKLHAYLILHYYNRHGVRYKTVKSIKLETSVTIKEEPLEPVPDAEVDLEEIQKQEPLADIITDVALDREATDLSNSKSVLSEDIRRSVSGARLVSLPNRFRRRLKGRTALIDDQNTLYARKEKDVRKKINKLLARVRYKRWMRVLERARRQYNERIRAMTAKKVDKDNNIKVKFMNITQCNNNETKQTDQNVNNNDEFKDNTDNKTMIPHKIDTDDDISRNSETTHDNTEKCYVSDNGTETDENITDIDEIDTDTVSLAPDNEINRVRNVYEDLLDIEENPVGSNEIDDLDDRDANNRENDNNDKELNNSNSFDAYRKDNEVEIKNCVILDDEISKNVQQVNLNNGEISILLSKEIQIENIERNDNVSKEIDNGHITERNIDTLNLRNGIDKSEDGNQERDSINEREKENGLNEGERGKNVKLKINTHQCYICYKLYETKEKLLEHCQVHFDVCSDVALKKCPLCNYVTERQITRHIKLVHGVNVTLPFNKLNDTNRNTEDKSRYYYNIDDKVVKEIEIIPSVKHLNKIAYVEIDKKNRISKDLSVAKTKLIKKAGEWVVEHENMNVSDEFILPEFDKKEIKRIKQLGDDYLDVIKALGRLATRHKAKMLFPCNGCDKMCQTYAALKLHSRRHETNPKPFKKKVWKHKLKGKELKAVKTRNNRKIQATREVRQAKPKPIENKHKCDKELMEFYEKNVKGADIEFWQFLKIYNRMNKEHAENLKDLKETNEFGDYVTEDSAMNVEEAKESQNVKEVSGIHGEATEPRNKRVSNIKNKLKVSNKFTRKLILSKEERLRRNQIKEQLRRKITES